MAYQGGKLSDGTPLNKAVYSAYRNAGLSHNQALAITAEVGRENSFNASILFGNHTDPAANSSGKRIRNLGMLSWNQGRDNMLEGYLTKNGVMSNGVMQKTQANLNAQAAFSVREMKNSKYAPKLKNFLSKPNASPDSFSEELGRNYVVWAYGQDTIKAQGGGRKAFNWRANDNRRRGYLNTLSGMLGGNANYSQPEQQREYARPNVISIADLQAREQQPSAFARPDTIPIEQLQQQQVFERPNAVPISQLQEQISVFSRPESVPVSELQNTSQLPSVFERPQAIPIEQLQNSQAINTPELEPTQEVKSWQL